MELPLAGYGRVSRVGTRDLERLLSPDQQKDSVEKKARELGREQVWFGAEIDVSGSKVNRPILDGIIRRIEAGELGGIIVSRLDRFARLKPRERIELFARVEDVGGVILSAAENIDPSTPEGRFTRDVFLGIARMEWERYKEGFDAAKATAMERGALIGPTPFGYARAAGGILIPHPERAAIALEAFRRAAREGLDSAVRYLDGLGLVRERGKLEGHPLRWDTATVRRLLSKRTYLGEGAYGKLRAPIPQLVPRSIWEAAQPGPAKRRRPKATFPLSGLAICAGCGNSMVGARGGPDGRRMYRCSAGLATSRRECDAPAAVTAETLEEYVRAELVEAAAAHPGYEGGEDTSGEVADAGAVLSAAEEDRAVFARSFAHLARTLGQAVAEAQAEEIARAVHLAEERFRVAARAAEGERAESPAADVIAGANREELGLILRGALDAVIVRKARGRVAITTRVLIIPKAAPAARRIAIT